ncbi:DUF4382 domain-containing protein [Natronococcus wangiae]|uniref:DUF4382 domain-containing protein n=1 Tax=Natronococcus wangiae TaxID=3068275 RepID=UPI003133BA6F
MKSITLGKSTDDGIERRRGFYSLDLEGTTVDLTEVIGDKAVSAFEGELSPGTYEKIELHAADVEGIVNGEQATVKIPSEKLQITRPFEIRADDPVDFVFDINVVKRGKENDYNLKPVISESGIAGKDVNVEEVDGDQNGGEETADPDNSERDEEENEDDTGENSDNSGDD